MIWSKLKKAVEALLADAVKDHLQLHLTRYGPGVSEITARGWLTWDGEEIASFSTISWLRAQHAQAPDDSADALREQQAISSRDDFYAALEEYITLPIEQSLRSPNAILRAFAMLDRRLGKRRLLALRLDAEATPPLVRRCYRLRCQAEGITPSVA